MKSKFYYIETCVGILEWPSWNINFPKMDILQLDDDIKSQLK